MQFPPRALDPDEAKKNMLALAVQYPREAESLVKSTVDTPPVSTGQPMKRYPDTPTVSTGTPMPRYPEQQQSIQTPSTTPQMPPIASNTPDDSGSGWDSRGTVYNDTRTPYQKSQGEYNDQISTPAKKYGKTVNGLYLGLQALAKVFDPNNNQQVQTYNDARKGYLNQRAGTQFAPIEAQHERGLKEQDDEINRRYKDAQIQYTLGRTPEQKREADAKLQGAAITKLASLPTFDPNNSAHKLLAKQAGKTDEEIAAMKKWDFRNPVEHVIDGERFKLDRVSGEYFPTNLPVDETQSETTYDVVDENGKVTATYHIPEKQAAQMAQAFKLKNLELKARTTAQTTKQTFDLKKQQIGAQLQKEMQDHAALIAAGKITEAEESKKRILDYQKQLIESMKP